MSTKLKPGQRPNHKAANQWTGQRGKNLEYIRVQLRKLLDTELEKKVELTKYHVWICRMLLACEGIHLYASPHFGGKKITDRDFQLPKDENGQVSLPDLLEEIDGYERDHDGASAI
jgi:hypothetical protein